MIHLPPKIIIIIILLIILPVGINAIKQKHLSSAASSCYPKEYYFIRVFLFRWQGEVGIIIILLPVAVNSQLLSPVAAIPINPFIQFCQSYPAHVCYFNYFGQQKLPNFSRPWLLFPSIQPKVSAHHLQQQSSQFMLVTAHS